MTHLHPLSDSLEIIYLTPSTPHHETFGQKKPPSPPRIPIDNLQPSDDRDSEESCTRGDELTLSFSEFKIEMNFQWIAGKWKVITPSYTISKWVGNTNVALHLFTFIYSSSSNFLADPSIHRVNLAAWCHCTFARQKFWINLNDLQKNKETLKNSKSYVPGSKLLILMMVIPPLMGNPYNGYINPYYWVDIPIPYCLLYGNHRSLDLAHISWIFQKLTQ